MEPPPEGQNLTFPASGPSDSNTHADAGGSQPASRPNHDRILDDSEKTNAFVHPPSNADGSDVDLSLPQIEGYEMLGQLGAGGMGIVYKVRQKGLNRLAALKMILAGVHAGPAEVARFRIEAEAVARLHHPNIVQVYEIKEWRPQPGSPPMPFFSLEYVDGGSLSSHLKGEPQPPRDAARLLRTLAEAMQYAHEHGVIHRDLKPANILLSGAEFPASRQASNVSMPREYRTPEFFRRSPKVADFGLAKRLDDQSGQTLSGTIIGTPSYMAPELAAGHVTGVGAAADIYSLGAILYELLTGRPPFRGASVLDTLEQVRKREPVPPSQLQPKLPRDLETICLKCLQKSAEKRYASAQALADDLRRFLAGETILARPVGPVQRFVRLCRRNPGVATLIAGIIFSLVVGLAFSTHFGLKAREGERRADREANKARDEKRLSDRRRYVAEYRWALQKWREGHIDEVQQVLRELEPKEDEEDLRGFEWFYLQRLCRLDVRTLTGHEGDVFAVAFSPDGRFLASASADRTVRIWDRATGRVTRELRGHKGEVTCVAYSANGKQIVSAGEDATIRIWPMDSEAEPLILEGPTSWVRCLALSRDGRRLAAGSSDKMLRLWNLSTHEMTVVSAYGDSVLCAAWSPDSRTLAFAGNDKSIRIWDIEAGKEAKSFRAHTSAITSVAFSHDGRHLASASGDQSIKVWDTRTWQQTETMQGHTGQVRSVSFSPDDKRLASGSVDRTVRIWDRDSGRELITLRGHSYPVYSVAFSPDGRQIASGASDRTIKFWDATESLEQTSLRGSSTRLFSVAFSDDRRWIAAGGIEGGVQVWDAEAGSIVRTLPQRKGTIWSVAFSPVAPLLAVAGEDGIIQLWEIPSGRRLADLTGHDQTIRCVTFDHEGRMLASGGSDQKIILWDVETRQPIRELRGHTATVLSVAFCPGRKRLASLGDDRTVRIWNLDTGEEPLILHEENTIGQQLVFSPDARFLAGGGDVLVRNSNSGEKLLSLGSNNSSIYSILYTPDGRRIVTAADADRTIRIWDAATGLELLTLPGSQGAIRSLALTADGQTLASAGFDGFVRLWDARPLTADLCESGEAIRLVRFMKANLSDRNAIRGSIERDATMSEAVRRRALDILKSENR